MLSLLRFLFWWAGSGEEAPVTPVGLPVNLSFADSNSPALTFTDSNQVNLTFTDP